jgi:hypothetical protein
VPAEIDGEEAGGWSVTIEESAKEFLEHERLAEEAERNAKFCWLKAQILCSVADFLSVIHDGKITRECRARPSYETTP